MSYLGKTYTLERQEKFDEFLASLGVDKAQIDALTSEKHSQTLVKNGDAYTVTLSTKASNQTQDFKSGVEFDENVSGQQCKTTFVVDGDTVTQTLRFVGGPSLTYKKKFSGDKLVVEATNSVWNGVAHRYYSA